MGDGRAEGSSAIGDGGQAATSLTPDVDGMHVCIFESSQIEGSYVGDLLYYQQSSFTLHPCQICLHQIKKFFSFFCLFECVGFCILLWF